MKYPVLRSPGTVVFAAEYLNSEKFVVAAEKDGEITYPFEDEYFNFDDADRAARKFAEETGFEDNK